MYRNRQNSQISVWKIFFLNKKEPEKAHTKILDVRKQNKFLKRVILARKNTTTAENSNKIIHIQHIIYYYCIEVMRDMMQTNANTFGFEQQQIRRDKLLASEGFKKAKENEKKYAHMEMIRN